MPELSFFIGKGGVGKTTVSSAYAVHRAQRGRRVLLLSTDPAHSLADLFQLTLGSLPKRLRLRAGSLHLWQIDAEQRFQQFLDKYRDSIFELVESGTIFTRKEIEPLLSTTLPGMAEVSALLAIADLLESDRYDELVVDTAPVGHTLRLFQMPQHFLRFLDFLEVAGSRDQLLAAHFGGQVTIKREFLSEWRETVGRVKKAVSAASAKLVLVTTPERFALNESLRAAEALAEDTGDLAITEIVLNRVVEARRETFRRELTLMNANQKSEPQRTRRTTKEERQRQNLPLRRRGAEKAVSSFGFQVSGRRGRGELQKSEACESCRARSAAAASAKIFLRQRFPGVPVRVGEDHGSPVLGTRDLLAFGEHVFGEKRLRLTAVPPKVVAPPLSLGLLERQGGSVGIPTTSEQRQRQPGFPPFAKSAKGWGNRAEKSRTELQLRPASWPLLTTPLSLTLGKGGVGKTTISAGLAFHHRRKRKAETVTICSTDPAPSLDDIFLSDVSGTAEPVLGDSKLRALEIDSVAEFRHWAGRMREKVNNALSTQKSGVHVDLSFDRRLFMALLDIVPPGVDELFAVFKILDLLEGAEKSLSPRINADERGSKKRTTKNAKATKEVRQARVLIDMAPTGHALELLRMPERMLLWSRLLLRALAQHRQLPLAQEVGVEIARISQRVRALASTLKDGKRSRLWPVMLAEPLPDRQTERLLKAIKELGAHAGPLFVNRVLLAEDAERCPRCSIARRWQLATLHRLAGRRKFFVVANFSREIAGAGGLQELTRELWM